MLESKEEMEKSLEDICKIGAGNCVESQDVSSSVCIKNPETIDEPEEVDKVEAESDIGADKTECFIHDRTPEGEVSCEGIGYVKSGDSNIVTMDVKEKPPESITYKLPLSVEEREEGRPPDGRTSGKKVSCSDTVDTAEINVRTDLDDTVKINDLVIDENRDVSIPSDSGEVPRIVGGDVPLMVWGTE